MSLSYRNFLPFIIPQDYAAQAAKPFDGGFLFETALAHMCQFYWLAKNANVVVDLDCLLVGDDGFETIVDYEGDVSPLSDADFESTIMSVEPPQRMAQFPPDFTPLQVLRLNRTMDGPTNSVLMVNWFSPGSSDFGNPTGPTFDKTTGEYYTRLPITLSFNSANLIITSDGGASAGTPLLSLPVAIKINGEAAYSLSIPFFGNLGTGDVLTINGDISIDFNSFNAP